MKHSNFIVGFIAGILISGAIVYIHSTPWLQVALFALLCGIEMCYKTEQTFKTLIGYATGACTLYAIVQGSLLVLVLGPMVAILMLVSVQGIISQITGEVSFDQ